VRDEPKTFSIAVMDRREGAAPWREYVIQALAERQITLRDGELYCGEHLIGFGRFEETAKAAGPLAAWIAAGERPCVGRAVGLFEWTHPTAGRDEISALVHALARGARGPVLQVHDGALRELVVRRSFRLDAIESEHGFEAGQALLERRAGAYIDDVVATIRARLAEAEIVPAWFGYDDEAMASENPVRLYTPVEHRGVAVPEARVGALLAQHEVELWAFRRDLYDGRDEFWFD
jgi:hypothetical protein